MTHETTTENATVEQLQRRINQLEAAILRRDLRDEGYESRPPSTPAAGSDQAACDNAECEHCGARKLRYEPYTRRYINSVRVESYRPLAVCWACGKAEEF